MKEMENIDKECIYINLKCLHTNCYGQFFQMADVANIRHMWVFIMYPFLDTEPCILHDDGGGVGLSDVKATYLIIKTYVFIIVRKLSALNKLTAVPILTIGMYKKFHLNIFHTIIKNANRDNARLICHSI